MGLKVLIVTVLEMKCLQLFFIKYCYVAVRRHLSEGG